MSTGVVKWYDFQKGFGFISPDEGGRDVFVHERALESAGLRSLIDGQKVVFETLADKRTGKVSVSKIALAAS